jgi:hypothetical protein
MLLRKVVKTDYGDIVDYIPGHIPDYLLLVRIDETKIPLLEDALPGETRHAITSNMGDRRCYSFSPHLTQEQIQDITKKLVELGAQSFEFRDWTNKISPPTKEKIIETKRPMY